MRICFYSNRLGGTTRSRYSMAIWMISRDFVPIQLQSLAFLYTPPNPCLHRPCRRLVGIFHMADAILTLNRRTVQADFFLSLSLCRSKLKFRCHLRVVVRLRCDVLTAAAASARLRCTSRGSQKRGKHFGVYGGRLLAEARDERKERQADAKATIGTIWPRYFSFFHCCCLYKWKIRAQERKCAIVEGLRERGTSIESLRRLPCLPPFPAAGSAWSNHTKEMIPPL